MSVAAVAILCFVDSVNAQQCWSPQTNPFKTFYWSSPNPGEPANCFCQTTNSGMVWSWCQSVAAGMCNLSGGIGGAKLHPNSCPMGGADDPGPLVLREFSNQSGLPLQFGVQVDTGEREAQLILVATEGFGQAVTASCQIGEVVAVATAEPVGSGALH